MTTSIRSNNPPIAREKGLHIWGVQTKSLGHHQKRFIPFMCYKCGLMKWPIYQRKRMGYSNLRINGHKICSACYKKQYDKKHK